LGASLGFLDRKRAANQAEPDNEPGLISLSPLTSFDAANAVPLSATTSAKTATIIAGDEARGKFIEVSELTRFGEAVRTNRFMPSRVVALIEERRNPGPS
jgi:hypothetical protein